ncbi:FAD-dependent oxidoreductase, partial [Candidatus Sumerlaeota bacterium]|nr:FAD-dependent oxidoreductase [Candidatus Sumerlaeota bacterium]
MTGLPVDKVLGYALTANKWEGTTMNPTARTVKQDMQPRRLLALLLVLLSVGLSDTTGAPPYELPVVTPALKALQDFRKPPREAREVAPGFLWIDAEDFADYGGWWIDTQFVAFMGSAYLIAAGVCKPVNDAVTTIEVARPGRYRLWVRSKNWHPEHSPGRFKVAINGQAAAQVFGAGKTRAWVWESGGDFDLPAGPARLSLQDLTGAYGRCDALILTTDAQYTPPDGTDALARERSRLTGISLEPRDAGDYDVVVVGAGTAGSCGAIAAARLGAKTILIQDRPVLGGNASIEMGVPPQGASSRQPNAREGGIMEEALRITVARDFVTVSDAFTELAAAETNLTVMLNERVMAVDMAASDRIAAVRMVNTLDGRISRARGKQFIDCTGDGWVGFYAGAYYRLGRESRAETGEELAVDEPDNITMSGCAFGPHSTFFNTVDRNKATPFKPPVWAAKLPPPEEFGRAIRSANSGSWWLEHEGTIDDLNDPELARDELIRIVFGYWDFLKNRWPERERSANYELVHVPIWNAKRETRRLMGDYVLTQQDVQRGRVFPDRISYGGWPLDVHHPRGIYSGKEGPFHYNAPTALYTIPYRCLYSRNIANLLFAGRNCSVTHVALGSVRVESTLATLGQAAGTAAGLCVRHQAMPRDIYTDHLAELQQVL